MDATMAPCWVAISWGSGKWLAKISPQLRQTASCGAQGAEQAGHLVAVELILIL